jgi:GxxExxY protein
MCYQNIIIELKALQRISNVELAQVINYLRATNMHRALLLNFGEPSLRVRRFVNNYE